MSGTPNTSQPISIVAIWEKHVDELRYLFETLQHLPEPEVGDEHHFKVLRMEADFREYQQRLLEELSIKMQSIRLEPLRYIELTVAKNSLLQLLWQQLHCTTDVINPQLGSATRALQTQQIECISELHETAIDLASMVDIAQKELEICKLEQNRIRSELSRLNITLDRVMKVR
jgi:hypothetical protein